MVFDALPTLVAEIVAYVIGKVIGRPFRLDAKRAQRIGEYLVIAVVLGAGVIVTLVYS